MSAVDGLIDDGHQRHDVKDGVEGLKDLLTNLTLDTKLFNDLIEEGILALKLSCLVVASKQVDTMRGNGFHAEQDENTLYRIGTTIDVVA